MEPQGQKKPLTKADFPQEASRHMRDMTPGQRKRFFDWVNGLEYVTDKRWPRMLIAKEKWDWAEGHQEKALKEFNAAALLASYLGREVKMLPEEYNVTADKQIHKGADAVAIDRTIDFKTSKRVQESYGDGREQALDVFITLPVFMVFMDKNVAKEQLHGAIDLLKSEYAKKNQKIDFGGEVYIACAVSDLFIHASVNTEGVTHWSDAPASAASHGERLHAHPAAGSEPQPRIPTLNNITDKTNLSNNNHATGVNSTSSNSAGWAR